MIKSALIGYGTIAPTHIRGIEAYPGAMLAAICDTNALLREKVPSGVPFYTDYRKMVKEICPDVVHICLPHYLHYPVARELAEMGCHVFCEKPAALNGAEGARFCDLAYAHPEIKIGICLQNRLNQTTLVLKELLDSGKYGSLLGLRAFVPWSRRKEYYAEKPWRGKWDMAGGGTLINQSLHTLDLLLYLGGEVKRLHAISGQTGTQGIEVEGDVVARLEYVNGAEGLFFATNSNWTTESVQIRVSLENGIFQIEDNTLYQIHKDKSREILARDTVREGEKFYYGTSHNRIISQFYQAVENQTEDYISVRDGVQVLRLTDAIYKSASANAPVEICG